MHENTPPDRKLQYIYCKLQHNTVFWDNPSVALQACLETIKSFIRSPINLNQY